MRRDGPRAGVTHRSIGTAMEPRAGRRRNWRWRGSNRSPNRFSTGVLCVALIALISPALGADLSAERVREILAAATPDKPADLSGKSLENLDLSKVDFKRANLSGANLFGVKLDGADLSGTNLS